jgi:hypothetical protein
MNAWFKKNEVCGTYIDLRDSEYIAGTELKVKIPIKINLHQILMLASVRYLPSFCGRWEIELYPNWNNLVVLPVNLAVYDTDAMLSQFNLTPLTQSFTQIGEEFTMVDRLNTNNNTVELANQRLTCFDATVTTVHMNLTTFQLRFEVFEGLRQMYAEQPLIIPTNILHYSRFSGQPGSNDVNASSFWSPTTPIKQLASINHT